MVCRLCLNKPGEFLEIFKGRGELVEGGAKEIIEKYFQIQIQFTDEISNKICLVCWRYLNEFHKFWLNVKEKQQTLQIAFDCMKIKRETSKGNAYEQLNSKFDGKNNILCEPELIIDDIKGEPNLAGDFDDSMNEDSSLLLPKYCDESKIDKLEGKVVRLNEIIAENIALKKKTTRGGWDNTRQLHTEIQELKSIVENQNMMIMGELATHNVLLNQLLHQESITDDVIQIFPLKSLEDVDKINVELSGPNKSVYAKAIKSLLKGKLTKKLDTVMSMDLIISFNIDGVHGKQSLKEYRNFFEILLDAIDAADPVQELRTALSVVKKRYFHKICIQKAAAKAKPTQ